MSWGIFDVYRGRGGVIGGHLVAVVHTSAADAHAMAEGLRRNRGLPKNYYEVRTVKAHARTIRPNYARTLAALLLQLADGQEYPGLRGGRRG
ncbi:MAG: hypothetical protein ACYDH4_11455 [Candidatus Cryosericum sp.]